MGYNTDDVYYQPESFGLTVLGSLNDPDANYSFDMFVVWKHEESGKIYWAEDSGCSCPSPFEEYTSLSWLKEVISMHDFRDAVKEYYNNVMPWNYDTDKRSTWDDDDRNNQSFKADALELIQKVREA